MSDIKASLQEMYDLGVKHGYALAEKDMEIERLQKEVGAINLQIFEKSSMANINNVLLEKDSKAKAEK